jgi:Protein of unknown function (DUF4241)
MFKGKKLFTISLVDNNEVFEFKTIAHENEEYALAIAKSDFKEIYPEAPKEIQSSLFVSEKYITPEEIIEKQCEMIEQLKESIFEMESNEYLGDVCVDSGQLLVVDPCYLSEWKHGDYVGGGTSENSYDEACIASMGKESHGSVLRGLGLSFSSGYGDGIYSVFGKRDGNGKIVKIEIDMSL